MRRSSIARAITMVGVAAILGALLLVRGGMPAQTVGSAGVPHCSNIQLLIRPMNRSLGAALGHSGRWYRIHELWGGPCQLQGFPGAELLDRNFHSLPPHVGRGGHIISATLPKREVVLSQQHDAYFALEYADSPIGNRRCHSVPYLMVTPPGDALPVVTFGDIPDCGGRMDVSPVEPTPVLR
jgi:hypothetical protein